MPVPNRFATLAPKMRDWRRWLHAHPELEFDLFETSTFVEARLRELGVDEIHTGIAGTGIVALIHGSAPGPVIALRADMDALPITEETGVDWASQTEGKMHACGHDGHTAMLLGAAADLAERRNFSGTAALVFQPAEESGSGGAKMIGEGVVERFGISRIFALHNAPGLPFGQFSTTAGPIMAAVDDFKIRVTGRGGHGALPHETADPIPALVSIVQAIQTIVSRNSFALDDLVVSVTQIHAGTAENIIPEDGWISGTVRSFDKSVQSMVQKRLAEIAAGQAASFGLTAELHYNVGDPATINDAAQAAFAAKVAAEIVGDNLVEANCQHQMGAEDFSHFLEKLPGAYLFLGQGEGAGLHHPRYEFNDDIAPIGAAFLSALVEKAQPL